MTQNAMLKSGRDRKFQILPGLFPISPAKFFGGPKPNDCLNLYELRNYR